MFSLAIFAALVASGVVVAQPAPLTPGTTPEGGNCIINWTPDPTGRWTETNIELMTGDNINMVHLTTITTVDTTSAAPASFEWPCPAVEPNSAIYFYQFSTASDPTNLQWTTRFAISGPGGELVEPENKVQPDATKSPIPWGVGALEDPSTAEPAPAYIKGQTSQGDTGTSSSATGSASVVTGTATGSVTGTAAVTGTASSMATSVARTSSVGSVSRSSASASASSTSANSGMTNVPSSAAGLVLGAVALGMMVLA